MKHYTIDEIDRFVHGNMSILARVKCSLHLKSCPECHSLISQLEKDDVLIDKLKNAIEEFDASEKLNENKAYKKLTTVKKQK